MKKSDEVKEKALALGFHKVGITSAQEEKQDGAVERLQAWLASSYHGNMAWMSHPKRFNIRQCMPEIRSVISVALNYYTPHAHSSNPKHGKISRYAWGRDYHKVMHKKLKAFCQWIESQDEGIIAKYYADTGPVQDKVWAQRAGLGWIGKNGNLITRDYGSWVFLGEVLTNLVLTSDAPHRQHCGTCTRCIDSCPTGAIAQPFVVDANRCIAYHTIENRAESLPPEIANNLHGWVAGCDICQDVCPWNIRFAKETDITEFQPRPWNLAPSLTDLATLSEEEWDKRFTASALRRIKPKMWQRNAKANLSQ